MHQGGGFLYAAAGVSTTFAGSAALSWLQTPAGASGIATAGAVGASAWAWWLARRDAKRRSDLEYEAERLRVERAAEVERLRVAREAKIADEVASVVAETLVREMSTAVAQAVHDLSTGGLLENLTNAKALAAGLSAAIPELAGLAKAAVDSNRPAPTPRPLEKCRGRTTEAEQPE
ncbi:hypothetical protein [Paludisphaera mucosa]|uniref:Uncharacterized protein n=1 Tax=Paludisphaera mucosa TaxID=3030827 RepID=A0ABT6FKT7_9BACT|nr:hypothetical protein [Paludisphaera mucosa]MDG3008198.1 hypothetical protein [Paludisphaera mucosa]